MSTQLLATKLHLPAPRSNWITRPRLTAALTDGLDHGMSLILVTAPPGYGKTTLLAEWCASQVPGNRPVAWLSLGDDDNDLTQFLRYVMAALEKAGITLGSNTRTLVDAPEPVGMKLIMTGLINDLTLLASPCLLVMDDYHFIADQTIHEAITFLLDHMPANLQLILASRHDPPLPLARWRSRGKIYEIRASDLQFSGSEAAKFLTRVLGATLDAEAIDALCERTEGWAAGLQLAALSLRERADLTAYVRAFTGTNRFVFQYLADEVLNRQSTDIQQFMLQLSILDRFCGPLADALTNRTGSQVLLERLYASDLFILPLDEEGIWYRYHHLFRDFLRHHLKRSDPARAPALYRSAVDWFERERLFAEAVPFALAIPDYDLTARLITPIGIPMIQRGEHGILRRWLDSIPATVLSASPDLSYLSAWLYLFTGQIERYEQPLLAAEAAWRAAGDSLKLGQALDQRAHFARLQGNGQVAFDLATQALRYLPDDDRFDRASSLLALAEGLVLLGDVTRGNHYLQEVRDLARASGNAIIEVLAYRVLGTIHMTQGKLHAAAEAFKTVLQRTETRAIWQRVEAHVGLATIYYEWNDLSASAQHLALAEAASDVGRRDVFFGPGYLAMVPLALAQGQGEHAITALARAEAAAMRLGHPVQLAEARSWALKLRPGPPVRTENARITERLHAEQIGLLRRWIQDGHAAEAVPYLERLLNADEAAGRFGQAIKVRILLAMACRHMGQDSRAIAVLERALEFAEPEGYVRTFIDEGKPMLTLLGQVRLRGTAVSFIGRLLTAFPPPAQVEEQSGAGRVNPALAEGVGERERTILRLIAQGLSNREIAETLVIAPSTVKWYIHSLYSKLNVKSRTQALARAQELRLLDP
jgi:LuxR family maltose regulon positive regulatory protein